MEWNIKNVQGFREGYFDAKLRVNREKYSLNPAAYRMGYKAGEEELKHDKA